MVSATQCPVRPEGLRNRGSPGESPCERAGGRLTGEGDTLIYKPSTPRVQIGLGSPGISRPDRGFLCLGATSSAAVRHDCVKASPPGGSTRELVPASEGAPHAARGASAGSATPSPEDLDPAALLAVLLGPTPGSGLSQAERMLAQRELVELSRFSLGRWCAEFGLSEAAARRVVAAFSLGRRAERARRRPRASMRSPRAVFEEVRPWLRGAEKETFLVLLLDAKHALQRTVRVSEGTLTSSLVHPREVFGPAIREASAAVVVAHNHPSGDPEPSREDLDVTRRLADAGRLLGIPLLDHVVVGDGTFVSLRERRQL